MVKREAPAVDRMARVRLIIYNIRYATGTGPAFHLPAARGRVPALQPAGAVANHRLHQMPGSGRRRTDRGGHGLDPHRHGQPGGLHRPLAGPLLDVRVQVRPDSVNQLVPIVRKQANAFLAAPRVRGERFHYFDTGIKRLIIELELDDIAIFLVHLSLKFRHRQYQLRYLYDLVRKTAQAGHRRRRFQHLLGRPRDLPVHAGGRSRQRQRARAPLLPELEPAQGARLHPAQPQIEVNRFEIPDIQLSDHLPLICDFTMHETERAAA